MNRTTEPHFLITRLSHIGDCVLTLPVLEAIKERWPTSRVTWAMESPTHKLLGHHPLIDQVMLIPRGYIRRPTKLWNLRQRLVQEKIDVVIDPQSLLKSAVLGWMSGAKIRIGFGGRFGKECSAWLNNHRVSPTIKATHLADRSLQLIDYLDKLPKAELRFSAIQSASVNNLKSSELAHLAIKDGSKTRLHLPLPEDAICWVLSTQAQGLLPPEYVVLNPGASWPSKRWENDRWAVVAQELARAGHEVVVTWAGDEESRWAEEIVRLAGSRVSLAPATTLVQMAALCRSSRLFLGCDTGPMHIATAVGTRCVVLFGPTRPQDSGPYGPGHVCLQAWHQVEASGQKKKAENHALRGISAEEVFAACLTCLQRNEISDSLGKDRAEPSPKFVTKREAG